MLNSVLESFFNAEHKPSLAEVFLAEAIVWKDDSHFSALSCLLLELEQLWVSVGESCWGWQVGVAGELCAHWLQVLGPG